MLPGWPTPCLIKCHGSCAIHVFQPLGLSVDHHHHQFTPTIIYHFFYVGATTVPSRQG